MTTENDRDTMPPCSEPPPTQTPAEVAHQSVFGTLVCHRLAEDGIPLPVEVEAAYAALLDALYRSLPASAQERLALNGLAP